jgi:hypothetical protein
MKDKLKAKIDKNRKEGNPVAAFQKKLIIEMEKELQAISLLIPKEKHKKFKIICAIKSTTMLDVIEKHIDEIIKKYEKR